MRSSSWFGTLVLIAAAVVAVGVVAPDLADRWLPAAAPLAHKGHDLAFGPPQMAAAKPAPAAPAAQIVGVTPVKRVDFPIVLEGLGQVQAFNTVTVKARVDGQITRIAFREGQDVKAGDLLAEIDPRPFRATLDQAKAKKTQDEANLANARLDLERYTTLAKQSFASQQQLDTQSSLVNQLTAAVAADAATIDAAQVQLDYTTIRAPLTGRIGFRLVDEGNLVSASQQTAIVTIAQLQPIAVVFTAPEDDVGRINKALGAGAPPVFVASSDGPTLASGKLSVTDNQVDLTTGTIRLKAEFANTDNALWPGLAVTTALTVGVLKDALTVPAASVQHGQNGLYVFIVDSDSKAALRPVKVSQQNVTTAVISDGLKEGDRVVTAGQFQLQNGLPVKIDASANGS